MKNASLDATIAGGSLYIDNRRRLLNYNKSFTPLTSMSGAPTESTGIFTGVLPKSIFGGKRSVSCARVSKRRLTQAHHQIGKELRQSWAARRIALYVVRRVMCADRGG